MSAAMNFWIVPVYVALFIFLLRWSKQHGDAIESSRVGAIRRFAAFYIDLFVALLGVLPIITIPTLCLEYLSTGVWQWGFKRDFVRPTDGISILIMLVGLYGVFYYFKWHFKCQKQTVGQHMLGFILIPSADKPNMGARAFWALCIAAWWPLWPWTLFGEKQDYWWDKASNIKARRVRAFKP